MSPARIQRLLSPLLIFLLAASGVFAQGRDWPRFGWDEGGSNAPPFDMGLGAGDLGSLVLQRVEIEGTVDSSPIYLGGITVGGARHDALFLTTSYGKTLAMDADDGRVLWVFTPPSYAGLAGSYRITNASPVADPDRAFIYAAAPDGMVRKLAVSDGRVVWSRAITRLPEREKIASALNYHDGRLLAATGGYIGDEPPYQGHVALIDAGSGELHHVWNSLGSDRRELMDPRSYRESDSGIWGRAGVVVERESGHLFVATGNGLWDGMSNWGDAVIELDGDAVEILGNFTPLETERLNEEDRDLGSSSPALLGEGLLLQGGKDGWLRLLDWQAMKGESPHRGGELGRVPSPSGANLFAAPAVLRSGPQTLVVAADSGATSAWRLEGRRLVPLWHDSFGGTSPVLVDGLALVYDPRGGLRVYEALSGSLLATLPCGAGHWNSPIVADGRIALGEGSANHHATRGILDIWRLPVRR